MCHVHLSKYEEVEACFGYCPPSECIHCEAATVQTELDLIEGRFGYGPGFCWSCGGRNFTTDKRACKTCEAELGPGLDYQGARIEGVEPRGDVSYDPETDTQFIAHHEKGG